MAGKIRKMLDALIRERSHENPLLVNTTKTRLILKGIDPDNFSNSSDDDLVVIQRIRQMADDFGIKLNVH